MSSMSVSVPSEGPGSRRPRLVVGVAVVGPVGDGGPEAPGDVGQLHAVHAPAVLVVEGDDLGELGRAALLVEHGDVGPGQHEVLDALAVDLLPVGERRLLDLAEQPAVGRAPAAGSSSCSWVPMIVPRRRTHGIDSSRWFQTRPMRPPGLSTRAISGSARSRSNQWKAWAATTASKAPVADGQLLGVRLDGAHLGQVAAERGRAWPGRGRSPPRRDRGRRAGR